MIKHKLKDKIRINLGNNKIKNNQKQILSKQINKKIYKK